MMLCDTAPLVAVLDRDDARHTRALATLATLRRTTLVTTWPCFTEAMYFLGRARGLTGQDQLWKLVDDGVLHLHDVAESEPRQMRGLMRQYQDAPMDLADASLVTAAERLGLKRIFTFDSHFHAFQIRGGHFEVVP